MSFTYTWIETGKQPAGEMRDFCNEIASLKTISYSRDISLVRVLRFFTNTQVQYRVRPCITPGAFFEHEHLRDKSFCIGNPSPTVTVCSRELAEILNIPVSMIEVYLDRIRMLMAWMDDLLPNLMQLCAEVRKDLLQTKM